jgi:hypothetical protein
MKEGRKEGREERPTMRLQCQFTRVHIFTAEIFTAEMMLEGRKEGRKEGRMGKKG